MATQCDSRERLLDAAHGLALRKGFDRTSISELITAAGVQRGSLYHYFPGKDDLGLAVLEREQASFMNMVDECLNAPTPLQGIERMFAAALKKHRNTAFIGGCLWGNTALEMSDSNPAFAGPVAAVFEQWTTKLAATIRAGQAEGQLRADVPAIDLARSVVAVIEGGIMMARLTKRERSLKTCLTALRALLVVGASGKPMTAGKKRRSPHRPKT